MVLVNLHTNYWCLNFTFTKSYIVYFFNSNILIQTSSAARLITKVISRVILQLRIFMTIQYNMKEVLIRYIYNWTNSLFPSTVNFMDHVGTRSWDLVNTFSYCRQNELHSLIQKQKSVILLNSDIPFTVIGVSFAKIGRFHANRQNC